MKKEYNFENMKEIPNPYKGRIDLKWVKRES